MDGADRRRKMQEPAAPRPVTPLAVTVDDDEDDDKPLVNFRSKMQVQATNKPPSGDKLVETNTKKFSASSQALINAASTVSAVDVEPVAGPGGAAAQARKAAIAQKKKISDALYTKSLQDKEIREYDDLGNRIKRDNRSAWQCCMPKFPEGALTGSTPIKVLNHSGGDLCEMTGRSSRYWSAHRNAHMLTMEREQAPVPEEWVDKQPDYLRNDPAALRKVWNALPEGTRGGLRWKFKGDNRHQRSQAWLDFCLEHYHRCSNALCPLSDANTLGGLFFLLQADHVRGVKSDKCDHRGLAAMFSKSDREEELTKCDVVCLWCHHKHTFAQNKTRTLGQLATETSQAMLKTTYDYGDWSIAPSSDFPREDFILAMAKSYAGCLHPLHSTMPWGNVASSDSQELFTFLQRSEYTRGNGNQGEKKAENNKKSRKHLSHMLGDHNEAFLAPEHKAGVAIATIHCAFCHKAWTVCENVRLFPTPFNKAAFEALAAACPDFVIDFAEHPQVKAFTKAGGWEKEVASIRAAALKSSEGAVAKRKMRTEQKKAGVPRKRRRRALTSFSYQETQDVESGPESDEANDDEEEESDESFYMETNDVIQDL
jgi:hypothetical protein